MPSTTKNIALLCIISYLFVFVNSFQLNSDIIPPQRLAKRDCDFSCRNQDACNRQCWSRSVGVPLILGVCHRNKCFCGWIPDY